MSTSGVLVNQHGKRSREPELENSSVGSSDIHTDLSTSPLPASAAHPTLNELPSQSSKILHLDLESESESGVRSITATPTAQMLCSLAGHRQTLSFASYEEYEIHYNKSHVNRCLECRKNFPTEHFLNLHIEETHDSLVSVKKERGDKTYSCFVEACDKKCSTPQKRRMHLIDKHLFPKDYDFYIVKDGIDHRSSMLRSGRHRRKSSAAQNSMNADSKPRNTTRGLLSETEKRDINDKSSAKETLLGSKPLTPPSSREDEDMTDLSSAMSSLKFVPPSVRFGRGRGRGFSRT